MPLLTADRWPPVSQRGVVFFRAQDNLTDDLQKKLVQQLGQLSGKPAESTLHVHPTINNTNEFGVADEEISIISSKGFKSVSSVSKDRDDRRWGAASWHSDIQFEEHPADYTSLRLTQLPPGTGGDTLWASGYELYDRFSEPYQKFLEGLTATFSGAGFVRLAKERPDRVQINKGPRGHPRNVGADLKAVHPVVRTNPVTGWKSIFAIGNFPVRINELSARESRELLDTLYQRILENHDLQVRFKWQNKNDIGKSLCHPPVSFSRFRSARQADTPSHLGQPQCIPFSHQRLRPLGRPCRPSCRRHW